MKPIAYTWKQATWPEHDVRGRGWYQAYGPNHPGMPWMTDEVTPLYGSQEPLTDEQIAQTLRPYNLQYTASAATIRGIVRAVERAHGIGVSHE